jgi:hypothetical protein
MEITEGGDMLDVQSFVLNLRGPSSTLPIGDPFLVVETWAGRVTDISGGGDFQPNNVFADGLVSPYSLAAISADEIAPPRIFSTERLSLFNGQITDISDGGSRESFRPYVTNVPVRPGKPGKTPLDAWPHGWERIAAAGCDNAPWVTDYAGDLFFEVGHLGQIVRAPRDGGKYPERESMGCVVAWGLDRIGGMKAHPTDGRIYAVAPDRGCVVSVDPTSSDYYGFNPPVVQGFTQPTCVRFNDAGDVMYVCSSGDGVVWKVSEFL